MQKPAVTQTPIHELLAERWSGRAYDATKPVTPQQIIALLEAARWAPSCFGDQPWRFVVWDKATNAAGWWQAFDCLAPSNQTWAVDAPVLMLVAADKLFNHNGEPNRWAQYDTGAAAENLCLQAQAMGLMAHQMGGFDEDKARALVGVPTQYTLMAMLTVGVQAEPAEFKEGVKERELAPRKRREFADLFFTGVWGKGLK
jgi:nitroreductase